ncbi:cyclin-like protein [Thamnocephalis sphaerospora]|uniref:Cyclin-like protein n=1 Tax=Thamnocephalis sphaerospora TaxID=78915 RepID=A0A4P9XV37_9FUNG|nr:cyclin-like protein [Thamnocephalis sphaerospora]|eukprot:RKP10115.1 cyclin-like protein [Thamnocephalis sphaerospora]
MSFEMEPAARTTSASLHRADLSRGSASYRVPLQPLPSVDMLDASQEELNATTPPLPSTPTYPSPLHSVSCSRDGYLPTFASPPVPYSVSPCSSAGKDDDENGVNGVNYNHDWSAMNTASSRLTELSDGDDVLLDCAIDIDDEDIDPDRENQPPPSMQRLWPDQLDWRPRYTAAGLTDNVDIHDDQSEDGAASLAYVLSDQMRAQPRPDYTCHINLKFDYETLRRSVVIWVIQTSGTFGFHPETAYLTVNYVDRYLSCTGITDKYNCSEDDTKARQNYQQLAATALLAAAKLTEEVQNPYACNFVSLYASPISLVEIKDMEIDIGDKLQFQYLPVTPHRVIGEICAAIPALESALGDELVGLAYRYIAVTSIDYASLHFSPALLAAAALDRAMQDLAGEQADRYLPRAQLAMLTGVELRDVDECACYLGAVVNSQWFLQL